MRTIHTLMSKDEQWLLQEKYHGEKSAAFFADSERLQAGEPLAYIIGWVPFLNTKIFLDSRPLIPRSETEYWTGLAITAIKAHLAKYSLTQAKVLDLCAGSGASGIAVAQAIPETHVTFGEIDSAHLPTIAENLSRNDIDCTRYKIFQSDIFENIHDTFDFILSNPPYIDPEVDRAEKSVKTHEPHLALYGGENGLTIIEKIIKKSPGHLNSHGQLWIEHEPEQSPTIIKLAQIVDLSAITHKDQFGIERFSTIMVQ